MQTYFGILIGLLEQIRLYPYFVLPIEQSNIWQRRVKQIINEMVNIFTTENVSLITQFRQIVASTHINEYQLSKILLEFFNLYLPERKSECLHLLESVKKRSYDFWFAEEIAEKKRLTLSLSEVMLHDRDILVDEMEFYGLDYFLLMLKKFSEVNEEEKKQLLYVGYDTLPGLHLDAEENDMLNKVVYHLWSWNLKIRMMSDYYRYRNIVVSKDSTNDEIYIALKKYCYSLLDILEEYDVDRIDKGLYLPYGRLSITELKKMIYD